MYTPVDVIDSWCKCRVAKYTSRFICTINKMEDLNDTKLSSFEKAREL